MIPYPKKPSSHQIGDAAIRMFMAACPHTWNISTVAPDYGLDLRIELSRDGQVTGEEFNVQVKGKQSVQSPAVPIRQATINYWLGKLNPTLIVLVDISQGRFFFDWLQHAYPFYPEPRDIEAEVLLKLGKRSTARPIQDDVEKYVIAYFTGLRRDALKFAQDGHLSKFLLHTAALAQACARISLTLQNEEDRSAEHVEDIGYWFFLEFGSHDDLLWSLWEDGSRWRLPVSAQTAATLSPLLDRYAKARGKFWFREHRKGEGALQFVPVRYSDLLENVLPTLSVLWDLQDVLMQLLALGRVVTSKKDAANE